MSTQSASDCSVLFDKTKHRGYGLGMARSKPTPKPIPISPNELQLNDDVVQLGVRLPRALLAALDFEIDELAEQCPGVQFTRSDGLRSILTKVINNPARIDKARAARARMEEEMAEDHRRKMITVGLEDKEKALALEQKRLLDGERERQKIAHAEREHASLGSRKKTRK